MVIFENNVFVFKGTFQQKYIPKQAGFRWDFINKKWYTNNLNSALKLEHLFDESAKQGIEVFHALQSHKLQQSMATSADIIIPKPEGLDYLPFQKAGIAYAAERKYTLIADSMGTGKGLIETTSILTPTGFKEIKELKMGDKIIGGSTGKKCNVMGIFPQGIKDVFKITFNDKTNVIVDEDHLWSVRNDNAYSRTKKWRILSTKELLNIKNIKEFEIPLAPIIYFKKNNLLPLNPYFLGVLLGNGGMLSGLRVHTRHKQQIEILKEFLPDNMSIKDHPKSDKYAYQISSIKKNSHIPNPIIQILKKLKVYGKRDFEKTIPIKYMYSSPEDRIALIQGLLDTDGTVKNARTRFNSSSKILAEQMVWLVRSLGGWANMSISPPKLPRCPSPNYNVIIQLPKEMIPFRLQYHLDRMRFRRKRSLRKIKSIESYGKAKTICISVDDPKELYIVNDFIVTHNTVQTIGIINYIQAKKVLIICPASIKINWLNELNKWIVDKTLSIEIFNKKSQNLSNILIINYDIAAQNLDFLKSLNLDLLVYDESQMIKNSKSNRAKAALSLDAEKVLALSGTPLLNRPQELWTIAHKFCKSEFPSWMYFMKRYCGAYEGKRGYLEYGQPKNLEELQEKLRINFMIRRLKEDVLPELPDKTRQLILIEDSHIIAAERKKLEILKAKLSQIDDNKNTKEYVNEILDMGTPDAIKFNEIAKIRYETSLAKVPYCIEQIKEILENKEKIIIFAHHKDVIEGLQKGLSEFKSVKLTGDCSQEQRAQSVKYFQEDQTVRIFFGSINAAGVGLTLTASSTVIFCELDWTPAQMTQCEDRCLAIDSLIYGIKNINNINVMGLFPIQEIKINDFVLTHKGEYKKVIAIKTRQHRGLITEIKYVGWDMPLICTHDHKILAKHNNELLWIKAHQLLPSDSMSFPKEKKYMKLEEVIIKEDWRLYKNIKKITHCIIQGCNGSIIARKKCNTHYREEISVPVSERNPIEPSINSRYIRLPDKIKITDDWLYLFGWYVAEGFASLLPNKSKFISFSGHEKERHILEKISKIINDIGVKTTIYTQKNSKGIEMRAYSGELAYWFREWFGHGAANKKLPQEILNLPKEQALMFLKGYTDGDGYYRKNNVEWTSASQILCYQICLISIRAGYIPTMRKILNKNGNYYWTGGYNKNTKITRLNDQNEDYIHRPIRNVKTEYKKIKVYDLTVEDDHSFTTGFCTVHNCHRIGQKNNVNVYHILLNESIDQIMAVKLLCKQEIIDKILNKD